MTKAKAEELLEQGGWFEVLAQILSSLPYNLLRGLNFTSNRCVEHEGPRFTGETCFGYTKNVVGGNDTGKFLLHDQ